MDNIVDTGSGPVIKGAFDISITNNAGSVDGIIGNGIQLDGSSQYLNAGEHRDRCFGNLEICDKGLTIAFWLKQKSSENEYQYIISSGGQTPTAKTGLFVRYRDNKLWVKFKTSTLAWSLTQIAYSSDDGWHHVAITWSADTGLKGFVDGCLKDESKTPTSASYTSDDNRMFLIGKPNSNSDSQYFGKFDFDEFVIIHSIQSNRFIWQLYGMP